jgi:hypothetical protein
MDINTEITLTGLARPAVISGNDKWEVGLCEFSYVSLPEYNVVHISYAFIYCDIIAQESIGSDSVLCIHTIAWLREDFITFSLQIMCL